MTAALEVVSGQQHALAALYPTEIPGTHCKGKVTPLQAGVDLRMGRGVALLFHDCGTRRG